MYVRANLAGNDYMVITTDEKPSVPLPKKRPGLLYIPERLRFIPPPLVLVGPGLIELTGDTGTHSPQSGLYILSQSFRYSPPWCSASVYP